MPPFRKGEAGIPPKMNDNILRNLYKLGVFRAKEI